MSPGKDVKVKTFQLQQLPYLEDWKSSTDFDTTIICEDGYCRAHKLVLMHASPLLAAVLDDQFPGEEIYYTIPDITKETMDLLIQLAYTGEIICNSEQLKIVQDSMKFLGFIQLIHCTITETRENLEIDNSQNIEMNKESSRQESIKDKVNDNETNKLNEQENDRRNNNNNNMLPVNEAQQNDENHNQLVENNQEGERVEVVEPLETNHSPKFSSCGSFDEAVRNTDFDDLVGQCLNGIIPDKVTLNPSQNVTTTLQNDLGGSSASTSNNTKASCSGINSKKEEGESSKGSNKNNKKKGSQKSKDNSQTTTINPLSRRRSCKNNNSNSQVSSTSSSSSSNTMTNSQKDDEKKSFEKTRLTRNSSPLKKTNDKTLEHSKTIKSSPRLKAKVNKSSLIAPTTGMSSNSTANIDSAHDVNSHNNATTSSINNNATTTANSMDSNDSPIMEGFEIPLGEEELRWIESIEESNSLFINQSKSKESKINTNNLNIDGQMAKKKSSSNTDEIEDEKLKEDESKHNQQGMKNTKTSSMTETLNNSNNAVTSEKENDIEVKIKSQEKRATNKQSSSRPSRKRSASPSLSPDSNTGSEVPESKKLRQTTARKSKIEKEKPTRVSSRLNKTKND